VRVSPEVKPSQKRKQMGGGVRILVALPLLNHTISAEEEQVGGQQVRSFCRKERVGGRKR